MRHRSIAILTLVFLIVAAVPAAYASGKPADMAETFGVGARADAMGDAFVAVADDGTASFWNPAGLAQLPGRQLMSVTKALPRITESVKSTLGAGDVFAELGSSVQSDVISSDADTADLTFYSLNLPFEKHGRQFGSLGISHSLVGYFDRALSVDQSIPPGAGLNRDLLYVRDRVQVEHTTLAYAWQSSSRMRFGLGVVQATLTGSSYGSDQLFFDDSTQNVTTSMANVDTSGKGYGYTIGALWSPRGGQWTFGGSYLSKISIQNLDSETFGDERPDRFMLGTSYVRTYHNGDRHTWALQTTRCGSANLDMAGFAMRNAVWNLNFGGEYQMHRGRYIYPVRYGFFTNASPNRDIYGYENWLTFGLGAGRPDNGWQADLAIQYGMNSKLSLLSLSGNYYMK